MFGLFPFALVAVLAYLLGSIPFGYILVRWFRGSDIRQIGSGNIGATNVARASSWLGIATLLLDAGKGSGAVLTGLAFSAGDLFVAAVAAFFVVLGHMFPIWLRFRGGKGVATGLGAFVAVVPKAVLVAVVIFLAIVVLFRYVSLGSVSAAAVLPVFVYVFYLRPGWPMQSILGAAIAVALLIIAKHHGNISRLLAGAEPRFSLTRE
jgi:glycerol-3-phosphate acyltransferase PlsY